jgi:hypothetical protein
VEIDMPTAEELKACAECGATIYPEHLERHSADYLGGKLLCGFCLEARRGSGSAPAEDLLGAEMSLSEEAHAPAAASRGGIDPKTGRPRGPQIQLSGVVHKEPTYKRSLMTESPHATRCKTFHCKMSDAPIVHLNEQINEWVDAHPDVVIKFATQTVGVVEGKHNDPHLLITIFY